MKNKYLVKGMLVGIAKIIPGFSGAVLMISFHLYDKAINAITNFFDNSKENFKFLLEFGTGVLLGITIFSKVIVYFLEKFYPYTTTLFIGLILGGIPTIIKEIPKKLSNYLLLLVSFLGISFFTLSNLNTNYEIQKNSMDFAVFLLSGFLEAMGTALPGISSTALLMLVGVYPYYLKTISNIFSISSIKDNIYFFFPFSIGLVIGIIFLTILINYLFQNHREQTYVFILGFALSSVLLLIIKLFPYFTTTHTLVMSLIMLIIGFIITNKI